MGLKEMTPHPGKHAKAKVPRPVPLVVKTRNTETEFEEEVERVKALVLSLAARLEACEQKVDASIDILDRTLQELATERESIQAFERELRIER